MISKFVSVHEPRVTSNARLRISNSTTRQVLHFCIWNFVRADKANWGLSAQTKFHIQKCNTCRVLEIRICGIISFTMVQYSRNETHAWWNLWDSCRSTAVSTHEQLNNLVLNLVLAREHSIDPKIRRGLLGVPDAARGAACVRAGQSVANLDRRATVELPASLNWQQQWVRTLVAPHKSNLFHINDDFIYVNTKYGNF
jgi:hypothetical protein